MQQNHNFNGSEHTSQALRTAPEIAKNRWTSLSKPAAHVDQAKNASWGSLGLFLEGFGRLLGLSWGCRRRSWPALGRSWVFVGRLLNASWALLVASGLPWVPPGWFLQSPGWLGQGFGGLWEQFSRRMSKAKDQIRATFSGPVPGLTFECLGALRGGFAAYKALFFDVLCGMRAYAVPVFWMQQNHSFNGSEHTSQALRSAPEIAKNRWTSLS